MQSYHDPHYIHNLQLVFNSEHYDPHSILGLHDYFDGRKVIRIWRPGAQEIQLEVFSEIVKAHRLDELGLFEYITSGETTYKDYRIWHPNGLLTYDPYAFWPTLGELDQYLFGQGVHYQLFDILGGRLIKHQGVEGVKFAVWAPSAKRVSLVGNFNYWDGRLNLMRSMGSSGIWELFIPGLTEGEKYKFEIKTDDDKILIKSDPFAYASEMRPATASVVANIEKFQWSDKKWMEQRIHQKDKPKPINIYEIHLGSWRKNGPYFLNYRDIAQQLAAYCNEMGYTHVELLPIQEHPLDESWGYQVTGFYAVTSRYGTPEDFQWFINYLHEHNIGVFIDWVAGHFPTDEFSLGRFDGTALYEHVDPRQGLHPHWNTYIFNFTRNEVSNFLIANAIYWMDKMHIDGLRVDAVASMLYLDYGRENEEWIPNKHGGKENLEVIEFFKHLNSILHQRFPGVLVIAEESTSFNGITHLPKNGGLGFDMKWNMGWMNDTLRYFSKDMFFRNHHQNDLTFGLLYAFSEKFTLVLSHDEVVHGKGSLIGKMPGDLWQKFANVRLLISYMMCQPGKKLLFMGGEIAQWNEWYSKVEVEWFLLQFSTHSSVQKMVKELNHLYLKHGCLWERDFDYTGFEWIDFSDKQNCVISYLRKGSWDRFLCVHNFTPTYHAEYVIKCSHIDHIKEIFNSDEAKYGGSGKINNHPQVIKNELGNPYALKIQLAPLTTMIFQV
jgi:1,4-alpha-glucan branching enzyme